jgi:hypothetical protein
MGWCLLPNYRSYGAIRQENNYELRISQNGFMIFYIIQPLKGCVLYFKICPWVSPMAIHIKALSDFGTQPFLFRAKAQKYQEIMNPHPEGWGY